MLELVLGFFTRFISISILNFKTDLKMLENTNSSLLQHQHVVLKQDIRFPLAACPLSRLGPCAIQVVASAPSPVIVIPLLVAIIIEKFWRSSTAHSQDRFELFLTVVDPLIQVSHPTSTPPGTCPPLRPGPCVTQVVPTSRSSVECTWDLKIRFIILTGNFSNVHPFPGLEPCYLEKVCSNCKGSSFRN